MNRSFRFVAVACVVFTLAMSGCTKEQMTADLLYGTWKLDSQMDNSGNPQTPPSGTTIEFLRTFYACNTKENTSCPGSTKTTTVNNILGSAVTTIDGGEFNYSVFGKTQLLIGGTYYEIGAIKKKSLSIHPVEHPLATSNYSKQ